MDPALYPALFPGVLSLSPTVTFETHFRFQFHLSPSIIFFIIHIADGGQC